MSSEITVFEVPESEIIVNKSQKQLEYEEVQKQTKIDGSHIDSMYEMDEELSASLRPKSTMPSIMLKYIIQYCMPIVAVRLEEKQYSISLQTEDRIIAELDGKLIAIPADQQFKIIGIKIPTVFLKLYNKFALSFYDHVSDRDLSLSGRYGLVDLQTKKFTQQRASFTHPGLPNIGDDRILLTSDENCLSVCKILLDYIDFIERYYRVHFPLIRYDLAEPDVRGTASDKWQVINGSLQKISTEATGKKSKSPADTSVKPADTPDIFVPFSRDLLNKLKEAQKGAFGKSFYFDILYTLDANKLSKLYNIGVNLGTDVDIFREEFTAFKKQVSSSNDLQRQTNAGHKIQLDIIKKKSIAFEKYGIDVLSELSKEQARVVDLEFNKLESKSTETGENNRKLFGKLKIAMLDQTSDALKAAIKEVESAVDAKYLNGDQLISGGVCPHTYQSAKKTLESFGRVFSVVDLRDFLINMFSLPGDPNGYFCKICGELLAEADNTSVMRFATDKSQISGESPLQTMIWKEAMYIISSNVRFITPIPTKPLINSIAAGLKEIVAHEEAKLYRSKTTLGDNVKDALNLYASIYIYAALCALMLQNPGRMMFARDMPADIKRKNDKHDALNARLAKTTDSATRPETTDQETKMGNPSTDQETKMGNPSTDQENTVNKPPDDDADEADHSDIDSEFLAPKPSVSKSPVSKLPVSGQSVSGQSVANEVVAAGPRKRRHLSHRRKLKSPQNSLPKYIKGGKIVTDSKIAEKFYLTTALKLIFLTKETIISRLSNMSADVVKQIFLKNAYPWAMKHARPINVDDESIRQTSENPIYIDGFYKYVYRAKKIAPGGIKPTGIEDVQAILGRDEAVVLSDIKNDVSMFATVETPNQWKMSKIPEFDVFTYRSFLSMLEYYQEFIYMKSRVPKHVQVSEHMNKYQDLLEMQFRIRMTLAKQKLRPNLTIPLLGNIREKYNDFSPAKLDLAKHFCPSGELHKSGSYVYTDGKKETEISRKEILEWLNSNNKEKLAYFSKLKIVDEICEKCKVRIRSAKSLQMSDKALSPMFGAIDDLLAFYQYYETRCPAGSLHDIQNDICNKCQFNTSFVKSNDKTYYGKYKSAFQKVQREKLSLTIRSLEKVSGENKKQHVPTAAPANYTFSLKQTADWSQISGVKYNLLVNIGLYEKLKFRDLENANVNPSKTVEPNLTRALRYKNHIHNVLRDYTLLSNHESVVDIPIELKEIFESQKKITIEGMNKIMPKFNDFATLDAEHSKLPIEKYINFLQEYLASIMIKIRNELTGKYETFGKSLIKYFTDSIINGEKFVSKPEPVFAKNTISAIEDNSEDEVGVSGDDWGAKAESTDPEKDVETYENDISNEAFDVENADDIWDNE